jgi:hypothetical protein
VVYRILKSSMDGISGGESWYASIDDVLRQVSYHVGWPSLKALHDSIRKWSVKAKLGDIYCTQVTAIVAVGVGTAYRDDDMCHHCGYEGLEYGELEPIDGGEIEQRVECPGCSERWVDVFALTEQRTLCKE